MAFVNWFTIVAKDENFLNRVHVWIIADGYDKLSEDFLKNIEKAGIFNAFETTNYMALEINPETNDFEAKFLDLKFINSDTMNENKRIYGANNIVHCFSRVMMFNDWFGVLNDEQQNAFKIYDYSVHDFLLGSSKQGQSKMHKFKHMPLPIHMAIKHKNQGKIESHKWFFKGFWEYYSNIKLNRIVKWMKYNLNNEI